MAAQPLHALGRDGAARLAQQHVGEKPARHADLAVDAPDRELDSFSLERLVPGEDVLIDAVDEGPVEIEEEGGLARGHGELTDVGRDHVDRGRR